MTSYSIVKTPRLVELAHDVRGWETGEVRPVIDWMFVSTRDIPAGLYPVIAPKPPHTVKAVLYDGWFPADEPEPMEECRCYLDEESGKTSVSALCPRHAGASR